MIKKNFCCLLLLVCAAVITACGAERTTKEGDDTHTDTTTAYQTMESSKALDYQMSMGFNLKGTEGLTYQKAPVDFSYYVNNMGTEFDMGVYMFVDGVIQPYTSDGSSGYIKTVTMAANQKTDVPVSFTPTFGMKGEQHSLRLVYVLNPDVVPDKENFDFMHNTSVSSPFKRTLELSSDIGKAATFPEKGTVRTMTNEDLKHFGQLESDGSVSQKMLRNFFVMESENGNQGTLKVTDGKLKLTVFGMGGTEETAYMVYFFLNAMPVQTEDSIFTMKCKGGENLTSANITLDIAALDQEAYKIGKYNTFYAMAVPLSGDNSCTVQKMMTSNLIMENK